MNINSTDQKFLGRDLPPLPLEIAKTQGNYLFTPKGDKYLDFIMGWCVGNLGWGNKEIIEEIKKFSGPDYVNPAHLYKSWAQLAELLAKITPGKLTKTFRATGGTEAVEIALQASMMHTKRTKFISIEGAYHGHSIGAMSIGASDFRKNYKNLLPGCIKIPLPLNKKSGEKIEDLLNKRDIAAVIMEPIICNLAVIIPSQEFFDIVTASCKKYGTLLIIDEVATGFGRTGKLFASEHFNLKPDIMCLAKGITGGYGALGATITTEEVAKSMAFDFSFYSTFGWHPLNVTAALANLKYFLKHKEKLLNNAVSMGKYFEQKLKQMKFKFPAEIRVKGLAIGIEFKKPNYAVQIADRCFKKKLIVCEMLKRTIVMFPALNIDKETAQKGLDIFESCV